MEFQSKLNSKQEPLIAPSLTEPNVYFIYRNNGAEVRVEVSGGFIISHSKPFFKYEAEGIRKFVGI